MPKLVGRSESSKRGIFECVTFNFYMFAENTNFTLSVHITSNKYILT